MGDLLNKGPAGECSAFGLPLSPTALWSLMSVDQHWDSLGRGSGQPILTLVGLQSFSSPV